MKKVYSIFLFLFISLTTLAQGIAVQGIARDAAGSALTNQNLTFTFIISEGSNAPLFEETQAITTDLFGVFSHIVGNGNASGAKFNSIDFSLDNLTLKISVAPNGNNIEIYNKPFQYTPYAHYAKRAANGVPTGAIMPFLGGNAPKGWVLCDGRNIANIPGSKDLIDLLGSNNSPNLKGRFLKGAGEPPQSNVDEITLKTFQNQQTRLNQHTHDAGTLGTSNTSAITGFNGNDGTEERNVVIAERWAYMMPTASFSGDIAVPYSPKNDNGLANSKLIHNHLISGKVAPAGDSSENRPSSYGVNYIIKL